jgi:hypothetical protein
MAAKRDYQLAVQKVRRHLLSLEDAPDATHERSLKACAVSLEIAVTKLRQFRDGTTTNALSKSLVLAFSRLLGTDSDIGRGDTADGFEYENFYGASNDVRNARYDNYDVITMTRPEADSACSVWADMVVTGSVGEGNRYSGGFEPALVNPDESIRKLLSNIAFRVNQYVLPDNEKHNLVRDMAKYGTWFEQVGVTKYADGWHIEKMAPMPVREMRCLPGDDPAKAFGRFRPGATEPDPTFPAWKIPFFANRKSRADEYGSSIFESCLRSWVQVEAMEGGMITRRLERAPMRYKWIIDTSGSSGPDDRRKIVNQWKEDNKKIKTVDGTQNYHKQRITPPAGEDLYVPRSEKESPADVSVLEGDAHLAEIADFLHFWNKWLSGLGPPKHHLGYEADTMRSVGTDLTIVFARKARRMQLNFIQGLNHLYWLELILAGIDPRSIQYVIFPPSLGTRDELVRAQVAMAYGTTIRYLSTAFATTGQVPSIQWFLKIHLRNRRGSDRCPRTERCRPEGGTWRRYRQRRSDESIPGRSGAVAEGSRYDDRASGQG